MTAPAVTSDVLTTDDPEIARMAASQPPTLLMYDTSNPRGLDIGAQVAAGYIGGATPHVWTAADWAAQTARWRLPIYVPASPNTGQAEGVTAAEILQSMGWPKGTTLGWDIETHQWGGEVAAARAVVNLAGYKLMAYGSAGFLFANSQPDYWWVADWTAQPHLYPHAGVGATQYDHDKALANGVPVDKSLIVAGVPLRDMRPPPAPVTDLQLLHAAGDQLIAAGEALKLLRSIP